MDELKNPLCFLRFLWVNLRYWRRGFWRGELISGHDFEALPSDGPSAIKCAVCGHTSVEEL